MKGRLSSRLRGGLRFERREIGSTLVLCPPGAAAPGALELAAALPADPVRTVVVAQAPEAGNPWWWTALAEGLRGRGPVRLAMSGSGRGGATAPAQWLAETLRTEVLAPDGTLVTVPGGSSFVTDPCGSGCWHRFRPGNQPERLGPRFPAPVWEGVIPPEPWSPGPVGVAEPIPAGLWLHAKGRGRGHAQPVFALPTRPEVLTVVLGAPHEPPLPLPEVRTLWEAIPVPVRASVRFVAYGTSFAGPGADTAPVGQRLADLLGEPVFCYAGLPGAAGEGVEVVATDFAGRTTWRPFATELGYFPRTASGTLPPALVGYRRPAADLLELRRAVFDLGHGLVAEVVPAGLWVREAGEPPHAPEVRARPADPEWALVTVGTPGLEQHPALTAAAANLVSRLEEDARRVARLVFCAVRQERIALPASRRALAPAPAPAPAIRREAPTEIIPAIRDEDSAPPEPAAAEVPATEPPVPEQLVPEVPATTTSGTAGPGTGLLDVEPAPTAISAVLDLPPASGTPVEPPRPPRRLATAPAETVAAGHHSSPAEQEWMRHTLANRFDGYAGAVNRILSEHPGLAMSAGGQDVVTDLVSVLVHLDAEEQKLDEALQRGQLGSLAAYAGCVVSGLGRLRSHRGPVVSACPLPPSEVDIYRPSTPLVEPAFLTASADLTVATGGPVEYLVWSLTGRRTDLLRPADPVPGRVVFPPCSRFTVLGVLPAGPGPVRVLLSEVLAGRDGEQDAVVLERLRQAATARDTRQLVRLPEGVPSRFGRAIGLT